MNKNTIADLRWQLKSVEFALHCFETEEKRKGNPRAIASLPPCQWDLPEDIKTLYDLQWELASELYCLGDWWPQPEVNPEPILPEP